MKPPVKGDIKGNLLENASNLTFMEKIKLGLGFMGSKIAIYRTNQGKYVPLGSVFRTLSHRKIKVVKVYKYSELAAWMGELVDRAPQDLSLGKWSIVTYHSAGFRVEAKGEGNSLLLLPFEYSSCLKIKENTSHRKPAISPTNLLQTGVVFDRRLDIEIKFTTGIFVNPFCRLEDAKTFKEEWVD